MVNYNILSIIMAEVGANWFLEVNPCAPLDMKGMSQFKYFTGKGRLHVET